MIVITCSYCLPRHCAVATNARTSRGAHWTAGGGGWGTFFLFLITEHVLSPEPLTMLSLNQIILMQSMQEDDSYL